jgi:anti-sigma factor RsiW
MTRCQESVRVQDYLDGELAPAERIAFRAHLGSCAACAAELASYQSVIATLERAPLLAPAPELTGRILARVLPSRARRRRFAALGLGYAAALAACAAGIGAWSLDAGHRALLEALSGRLSHQVLGIGLFLLNSFGASVVRLANGWGWVQAAGGRLAPLSHALGTVFMERDIALTVMAAAAVCTALIWWMRPRTDHAVREVRHVSILGF